MFDSVCSDAPYRDVVGTSHDQRRTCHVCPLSSIDVFLSGNSSRSVPVGALIDCMNFPGSKEETLYLSGDKMLVLVLSES